MRLITFFLSLGLLGTTLKSGAQQSAGCFQEYQLQKMQKTTIADIRIFLAGEGWEFSSARSDQSFSYHDYGLTYHAVQWQKTHYETGGTLTIFYYAGKPNIVSYQPSGTCFQQLLKKLSGVSKTGTTKVADNMLCTYFVLNGMTMEFRETMNDYAGRQYEVLLYNAALLNKDLQQTKKQAANTVSSRSPATESNKPGTEAGAEEADDDKVYEKVEITASVNPRQWRRHLESQLSRYVEEAASSGMAPGNYTVNVRFLVEKDGNISDVKAMNDPGYGLGQGAVEVVRRGPKWSPGERNGRKVRSYHTQPISFQIQEQ